MEILEQKILKYIQSHDFLGISSGVVLGVSGGADSVCLFSVFLALLPSLGMTKDKLAVVHVHHRIRGAEADRDAAFVKALCDNAGVSHFEYKKDIPAYARACGMSVEEAGRSYRYQCMEAVRKMLGFGVTAVAHNEDDIAETVLFHLMRGSGIQGMSGIAAQRGTIIRPLLCVSRAEIEQYLAAIGQSYCEDSTNRSLEYTRNKIRHVILPAMKEINGQTVSHIGQLAKEMAQSYEYMQAQAWQWYDTYASETTDGKTVQFPVKELCELPAVLQEQLLREAICRLAGKKKDITRTHINAVRELLWQDTGKRLQLPYGIVARKNYGQVVLAQDENRTCEYCIQIQPDGDYTIPEWGILSVSVGDAVKQSEIPKKNYTKWLDYDKIKGTLCIRTPEPGDSIAMDTTGKKKKLSRVFIDAKIDRTQRTSWPVIACGNEVIWAVGLRFNPMYHIDGQTKRVMKIKYQSKGEQHGTKD